VHGVPFGSSCAAQSPVLGLHTPFVHSVSSGEQSSGAPPQLPLVH
jgi:hypothetical protein